MAAEQLALPLDFAPRKVRRYGLRDAHSRPLVGRRTKTGFASWRTWPAKAWTKPYLELNAANSFPAVILDCDDPEAAVHAWLHGKVCEPSWIVTNRESNHFHVVWNLAVPIHRYPEARPAPLRLFRRVAEFYQHAMHGDAGYPGVLTRNPMARADPSTVTTWGRREPYELAELARVIPLGWRAPTVTRAGIGRNCDLFAALMRWAGRSENRGVAVLAAALVANQEFTAPLPLSEVRATARMVEKYRAAWLARGWHCPRWIARQAARGRKSKGGGRPRLYEPGLEPWTLEGISRATWYRHRSETKQPTQVVPLLGAVAPAPFPST